MATSTTEREFSSMAIPPGEFLEEELEARGMSQRELASRTGRPEQVISGIVNGRKAITEETALELEKVLGIPAHFWVNLEAGYRMTLARNRERARLEKEAAWLRLFPVKEMRARGCITEEHDKQKTLASILMFFGVASFDALQDLEATTLGAYRVTKAAATKISRGALWAWLRCGDIEAASRETAPYIEARFLQALRDIRGLTTEPIDQAASRAIQLCAEAGVVLVIEKEFPKSGANGVTRWLAADRPLIQLSTRWRWQDIFWFTFFHEARHVLDRKKKVTIVDLRGQKRINASPGDEAAADKFARDILIPQDEWDLFVATTATSVAAVRGFASHIGVAPGVVVGRLQHEEVISHASLNSLRRLIQWKDKEEA